MAINYVSPDDRVAARKKVMNDFINVSQPAQAEQNKQEKDSLKKSVLQQTSALGSQSPQLQGMGSLGILQTAQNQGAGMLNTQAASQDKLNVQGAGMQQGIADARSQQSVQNVTAAATSSQDKLARSVANRAFANGMEAKQLMFHENSALADYSLQSLSKDFESGRVSQKELQSLQNDLRAKAQEKQQSAALELDRALKEFQWTMKQGNADRAKQRVKKAFELQKDAMKEAARASGISSIISGVMGGAGAIVSKWLA